MISNIVTNMKGSKKKTIPIPGPETAKEYPKPQPWKDIPIEIIIEHERQKKEREEEHQRKRLYAPSHEVAYENHIDPPIRENEDYKIVIKL